MGAERVVFIVSYLSDDLTRVVTLHATVVASGPLTYLVGRTTLMSSGIIG
jgi:hypothetical protein